MSGLRRPRVGATNTRLEPIESSEERILRQAGELVRGFSVEEIALIQRRRGEQTVYSGSGPHKAPKRKGGSPPIDYDAVEAFADLQLELGRENPDYQIITRNYFYLRALLR